MTDAQPKKSDDPEDYKMPLIEHLAELRKRLLWAALAWLICSAVCLYFAADIFNFLAQPLNEVMKKMPGDRRMIYTQLYEKFFTDIKVGLYAGFFFSFPIFAQQMWKFVAPGLYKSEKNAFLPFLLATPFMFVGGAAFAYFLVFPAAYEFFALFEQVRKADTIPIEMMPRVADYLSLVIKLIFAFGICFELPVLLTLLVRAGLTTTESLARKRRYAIVFNFAIAAFITPPDALSMLMLAVPMCLLYEVAIVLGKLIEKDRAKREAQMDAELKGTAQAKGE